MNLESRIQQALAEVRVFLKQHEGDIELVEIKDNDVYIKLTGACKGCPLSFFTLSSGVDDIIRKHAPEIGQIIAVDLD